MEKTLIEKAAAYEMIEMKMKVLTRLYTEFIEEKKEDIKKSKEVGHPDYVIKIEETLLDKYEAKLGVLTDLK